MNRKSESYQTALEQGFDEEFEMAWIQAVKESRATVSFAIDIEIQEDPWQTSVAYLPSAEEPF